MPEMLNLGCGKKFHKDWVNIDFVSMHPEVRSYDLSKGIPFENDVFEVVYHSHVLEHFSKEDGESFIKECHRVLKKGGIIRVVIPDLETIITNYIKYFNESITGIQESEFKYDWTMLEMYDQTTRFFSGGNMANYIKKADDASKKFILSRLGSEARQLWEKKNGLQKDRKRKSISDIIRKINTKIVEAIILILLGKRSKKAFRIGQFKTSGESHLWMYDRFSLGRLLLQSGFNNARVCKADESSIPHFNNYNLDIENNMIRKPDSLFIEAIKA